MTFYTFNYLVFGGQNIAEEIKKNEICAFLIRKKHLYENLWEDDFDTHIKKHEKKWILGNKSDNNGIFWYDKAEC